MREVKEIETKTDNLDKIAKWKADIVLCDQIMSKPVQLSINETKRWYENNHMDPYQEIRGIYLDSILVGIARLMFINKLDNKGEIGLYIGFNASRGTGLGKLAVKEILRIAEEDWALNKVYARVRFMNETSIKLFKGLGFIEEGRLKSHYYSVVSKEWDDVVYLAKFLK